MVTADDVEPGTENGHRCQEGKDRAHRPRFEPKSIAFNTAGGSYLNPTSYPLDHSGLKYFSDRVMQQLNMVSVNSIQSLKPNNSLPSVFWPTCFPSSVETLVGVAAVSHQMQSHDWRTSLHQFRRGLAVLGSLGSIGACVRNVFTRYRAIAKDTVHILFFNISVSCGIYKLLVSFSRITWINQIGQLNSVSDSDRL